MSFQLHPQLAHDTIYIGHFPLCDAYLSRDAHYPWVILVPPEEGIQELYELRISDQMQLMRESCTLSKAMAEAFEADKMNVAALGNVVPQLHIHHIVRHKTDPAWPGPIWGKIPALAYSTPILQARLRALFHALEQTEFKPVELNRLSI